MVWKSDAQNAGAGIFTYVDSTGKFEILNVRIFKSLILKYSLDLINDITLFNSFLFLFCDISLKLFKLKFKL